MYVYTSYIYETVKCVETCCIVTTWAGKHFTPELHWDHFFFGFWPAWSSACWRCINCTKGHNHTLVWCTIGVMPVAMHLVWLARPSWLWDGLANRTSHPVTEPQVQPLYSSVSQLIYNHHPYIDVLTEVYAVWVAITANKHTVWLMAQARTA